MATRIYICHTFYHVYIACLKELHLRRVQNANGNNGYQKADLILSLMSNNFGNLHNRAAGSELFENVYDYDERKEESFEELKSLKQDTGSLPKNMLNRIKFCKRLGQLQEEFIPVDLKQYADIYVFCDSDPIGYYLNYKKIRYHALEDGLDCIKYYDTARFDNRGHFGFKKFMASTGLIFIQNGYGKYCIDMEVNDISALKYPCDKYIEVNRKSLQAEVTEEEKHTLLNIFVEDIDSLNRKLDQLNGRPGLLVLSEPLCDLDTRQRIFGDIIDQYGTIDGRQAAVIIKQHPRDLLDYSKIFTEAIILPGSFPMEMLAYIPGISFERVVSVYTVIDSIDYAKEKVYLGDDFMDLYEEPSIHRQNEQI